MVNVRAVERDQQFLMPPSLSDWLPEDHLAWFIIDLVAELDLAELYASLRADGRGGASYHPEMMLGVLLYAYCVGERSSRRIERRPATLTSARAWFSASFSATTEASSSSASDTGLTTRATMTSTTKMSPVPAARRSHVDWAMSHLLISQFSSGTPADATGKADRRSDRWLMGDIPHLDEGYPNGTS